MRPQNCCDRAVVTARNVIVFLCLLVVLPGAALALPGAALVPPTPDPPWSWPVEGLRSVTVPFRAPTHDYGPGHRGIDMVAPIGTPVHAPADGVVAFRGVVVDRPLITIDHGGGIVTTFEPLDSTLTPGTLVTAGDEMGTVSHGGHTPADHLHLGVRYHDVYMNPMLMFADVPRAILLPCCASSSDALRRVDGRVGRSL